MANLFSNPRRILIITIVLASLIIGFTILRSRSNDSPFPTEVNLDYEKLYTDALKAKKKGDLNRAQENLQKIVLSDPKYKDASKLMKDVTKENLYKKTKDALARNQLVAAQNYLNMLNNLDPNYKDSAQIRDDVNEGTNPSDNPNDPGPPGTGSGKGEPPDVQPIQLLPDKIEGFDLLARNWMRAGIEANAAYRHVEENKDYWAMTDMVLITASKYENENEAKARFLFDRDTFPNGSSIVTINNHEAHFGLYADKIAVFPGALIWTQGKWKFSVTVIPKPPPHIHRGGTCPDDPGNVKGFVVNGRCTHEMSPETELKIAKDVATKFGY